MRFFKPKTEEIDYNRLPVHIGFIMDGNGRWAKKHHLPRSAGHRAGANTLRNITRFCNQIGIRYITVYAFSTENWKRSEEEVNAIMDLLMEYLKNADELLGGENARIRVIGDVSALSQELQQEIARVERDNQNHTGMTVNIALNYGGREEIVTAAKHFAAEVQSGKRTADELTPALFNQYLYTADSPDPDLIIRTSGEMRLSNFLLWQCAYSEFWFTKTLWPDFSKKEILAAILNYQKRQRRFGGR